MTTATRTDYTTRSPLEARALELLDPTNMDAAHLAWTPERQVVAQVFRAMWSHSLPADRVNAIGSAMNGFAGPMDQADIDRTLKAMVRLHILRTSRRQGRTFYEVRI